MIEGPEGKPEPTGMAEPDQGPPAPADSEAGSEFVPDDWPPKRRPEPKHEQETVRFPDTDWGCGRDPEPDDVRDRETIPPPRTGPRAAGRVDDDGADADDGHMRGGRDDR